MRNKFEEQLMHLNNELITMGALCEEAISGCVKYLFNSDSEMKEAVIEVEKQIDQKERDIEQLCMKLLIQQQPVATDFRIISSALKMISDMERIGDQASDIAEIVKHIDRRNIDGDTHISAMAKETIKMVTDSIESFVKKDIELATDVIKQDDNVDELFNKVKDELIETLRQPTECAEALIDLLMIAKYFERIGDHAENIAEWVIFSITGQHIDIGQND
ncbi:MAG: phosphate transport system regulatory protein PhoU [Eubacteriales Family XIII. Incertae Sedis bacterium]|nr:MAG: phosphate transport system regulatory protein PhoU [Clostridiales Family XIII bacterium]